ncbi:30S ribosomal protein S21 [Brachyspira alvinipulli]|uniref:30S ribosomal protein S21 n=1 Tax=Brachyspira alvinipulli TaxID=84379 RepID=UPI0026188256|nr:30S ribosomal protein S21 [uncultured Brachyspira sp.]
MVRVFANEGEQIESVIKRFRRACENEGILQDLKEKQFYKKPSLEKKLQREKALKRMKRKIKKERRLGLL